MREKVKGAARFCSKWSVTNVPRLAFRKDQEVGVQERGPELGRLSPEQVQENCVKGEEEEDWGKATEVGLSLEPKEAR